MLVSESPLTPWASSPWPITMTMGTSSMDTVSRQPATSAAGTAVSCQQYTGAVERWKEIASCSCLQVCALKRECQWIYHVFDLKSLNSAFNLRVEWRKSIKWYIMAKNQQNILFWNKNLMKFHCPLSMQKNHINIQCRWEEHLAYISVEDSWTVAVQSTGSWAIFP